MDQSFRRGFAAAEQTELWDRWQRGESLKAIDRLSWQHLADIGPASQMSASGA